MSPVLCYKRLLERPCFRFQVVSSHNNFHNSHTDRCEKCYVRKYTTGTSIYKTRLQIIRRHFRREEWNSSLEKTSRVKITAHTGVVLNTTKVVPSCSLPTHCSDTVATAFSRVLRPFRTPVYLDDRFPRTEYRNKGRFLHKREIASSCRGPPVRASLAHLKHEQDSLKEL